LGARNLGAAVKREGGRIIVQIPKNSVAYMDSLNFCDLLITVDVHTIILMDVKIQNHAIVLAFLE
jgi:hypothetical protein